MRPVLLAFLFLFSSTSLKAQQLPEWYRVYTFDESIIEMNTSLVTFISKDITRVRFRWTFDQPAALSGDAQLKYKSRLEVMEFNCSEHRYRPFHLTFFDAAGNIIRIQDSPGEWRTVTSGSMMQKLFAPACELIKQRAHPPVASSDAIELEKVTKFALSFSKDLEQAEDFKPILEKFFVANYLNGYLHDNNTNWFLNLNRETATKVSRAELQRFYVALLNTGYLSCIYFMSRIPTDSSEFIPDEKLIPIDIARLIKAHRYTATYKRSVGDYDYLGENIDSIERLRSYTDLLERISALMRKHVIGVRAERSKEYQAILEDSGWTFDLYQPRVRVCAQDCLGLPRGTRLFEVNVPVFRLQLAEISGQLKVVSAIDYFE
jgi:hypothetical protein